MFHIVDVASASNAARHPPQACHPHASETPLLTAQGTVWKRGPWNYKSWSQKVNFGGRSLRGCDHWLPQGLNHPLGGPMPLLLSLECVFPVDWMVLEDAPRLQPWDSDVVLRLSEQYAWLNPVLASIGKLLRFGRWIQKPLISWMPETNLVSKFLCSLKLPPPNLEGLAPVFGLWVQGPGSGYIREAPEKLVKQQTSIWLIGTLRDAQYH